MNKETFLLNDIKTEIESSFIKAGWVTIYKSTSINGQQKTIFCCLLENYRLKSYLFDRDWRIYPTCEGKPSVFGVGKYQTYADKGIEPFIFSKYFSFIDGQESYIDISEEFILYFKLYEKGQNKQNRIFYYIDENGDLDEVIVIEQKNIKIKLRYLKEYISIRKVHFSICFDFLNIANLTLNNLGVDSFDIDYKSENYNYSHLVTSLDFEKDKSQSWIHGKTIIHPDKKLKNYHFDYENAKYEEFIVGYDKDGQFILKDCSKTNDKLLTLTFFKKEVLNKYYNEPDKYDVDGFGVSSKFFSLKIDNNVDDYVPVFLTELGILSRKEQLHWKQYNIPPQKGVSSTFYNTMIEGNWAEYPDTPDLYFKHKYESFNEKWEQKFGWKFYKPLSKEDTFRFTSLHIPTTNNVKSFCEQILSLSIITIDRLNEEEIKKQTEKSVSNVKAFKKTLVDNKIDVPYNVVIQDKPERGLAKLEKFLEKNAVTLPEMNTFLRTLYDLRSGLLAHSFSDSNDKCKKALAYFGVSENNYIEVAKEIFIKAVITMNTLEKKFNLIEKTEVKSV